MGQIAQEERAERVPIVSRADSSHRQEVASVDNAVRHHGDTTSRRFGDLYGRDERAAKPNPYGTEALRFTA
jgi:hypothetical protein